MCTSEWFTGPQHDVILILTSLSTPSFLRMQSVAWQYVLAFTFFCWVLNNPKFIKGYSLSLVILISFYGNKNLPICSLRTHAAIIRNICQHQNINTATQQAREGKQPSTCTVVGLPMRHHCLTSISLSILHCLSEPLSSSSQTSNATGGTRCLKPFNKPLTPKNFLVVRSVKCFKFTFYHEISVK